MTIHVNIGDAKTRLSELVAAAVRGEEVVLDKAGTPQVRLTPVSQASDIARARQAEKRRQALACSRKPLPESISAFAR
ncbi:type II toxin-antitoxin system Phd/YefM family antitoxin [uncultured Sphingomonas sp.]|uniref:type II toxin-antitoxin system Phd/YefM family antitoxin n=1 Tax=uncultured Sphingomonas sp. TaxID=158754 RepID=UPI0035CA43D5